MAIAPKVQVSIPTLSPAYVQWLYILSLSVSYGNMTQKPQEKKAYCLLKALRGKGIVFFCLPCLCQHSAKWKGLFFCLPKIY